MPSPSAQVELAVEPDVGSNRPLWVFLAVVIGLAVLRALLPFVSVPIAVAYWSSLLITAIFMSVPILALYHAAKYPWTPRLGLVFLIGGIAVHAAGALIASRIPPAQAVAWNAAASIGQIGLLCWCVGLGALLASLVRDKNLLLPIGLFLAGFDIFTVVSKFGITRQILIQRPEAFRAVAYQVPTAGSPEPQAFVGPADMFFLAMFFVAVFRFRMRSRETLSWVLPVLIAYVLIVILLGDLRLGPMSLSMLPALVPIGATVLLVNRREFVLTSQEKVSTAVIGLIAAALAVAGFLSPIKHDSQPIDEPQSESRPSQVNGSLGQ